MSLKRHIVLFASDMYMYMVTSEGVVGVLERCSRDWLSG